MFSTDGLGLLNLPPETKLCKGDGCGVKSECKRYLVHVEWKESARTIPEHLLLSHVCRSIDERESFVLAAKDE